ncbi:MAG: tetratricopeptide repeat protein [Acidobacteria bacterium]|nr:tetratricopeptide repeat protein [Acidobacteriota bacterium]MDW7984589.1 tetratricopeptide repeat protein [Acidobacteriota bacterium]
MGRAEFMRVLLSIRWSPFALLVGAVLEPTLTFAQEVPVPDPVRESYIAYMEARMADLQGDLDRAEHLYRQALDHATAPGYVYYELGSVYRRKGRWQEAARAYESAVSLQPDLGPAWRELGEVLEFLSLASGDANLQAQAVTAYQRYLEYDPDPRVANRTLYLLIRAQQHEAAIQLGEKLLTRVSPDMPQVLFPLFEAYMRAHRPDRAEAVIRRYIAASPEDPDGYRAYALLLLQQGRQAEAQQALRDALARAPDDFDLLQTAVQALQEQRLFEAALQAVDTYLDRHPDEPSAWFLKAHVIARQKGPSQALAFLDEHADRIGRSPEVQIRRLLLLARAWRWSEVCQGADRILQDLAQASDLPLSDRRRYQRAAWILKAQAAMSLQDYETALRAYTEAYALDPQAEILEEQLRAAILARQHEKVPDMLANARARFPQEAVRWTRSEALFLEARGRDSSSDAEKLYQRLVELDPDEWTTLVAFYQRTRQFKKAERLVRERLQQNPRDVETLFTWANLLERMNRVDEAAAAFQQVLQQDPNHAAALNNLGYMWADRNMRLSEALMYIQKALEIEPESPAYLDSLAWVYYRMGDYTRAWTVMQDVLRRDLLDPVVFDHAGDISMALGKTDEAVTFWQKALDVARRLLHPPVEFRPEAVAQKLRRACPTCQRPQPE